MDPFEYISVISSVVIGLSITHLLRGMTDLIEARERVKWFGVHIVWVLNALLMQLVAWWVLWTFHDAPRWDFWFFLFLLLFPVGLYVFSALLLPRVGATGEIDLKQHYLRNSRWIHGVGAVVGGVVVLSNLLVWGWSAVRLGNLNLWVTMLFVLVAVSRSTVIHGIAGVLVLVVLSIVFAATGAPIG